jgi:hypothetical protein
MARVSLEEEQVVAGDDEFLVCRCQHPMRSRLPAQRDATFGFLGGIVR